MSVHYFIVNKINSLKFFIHFEILDYFSYHTIKLCASNQNILAIQSFKKKKKQPYKEKKKSSGLTPTLKTQN